MPLKIEDIISSINIAEDLEREDLAKISALVTQGLELDKRSQEKWIADADKAMELCKQERSPKHYPRRDASNIKYPLVSTAALQFSSRAISEVVKNGDIVKYKAIGRDPDGRKSRKGERVKTYINYLILNEIPGWYDYTDKELMQLSVVGTAYKKTWYDVVQQTIRSELVPYDLIVVNQSVSRLEDAPRITQYVYMPANQLVEHFRYGIFREIDLEMVSKDRSDPEAIEHELIECHTYLDLDEDGYAEPYIITLHRSSGEVLRIVARFGKNDIKYNQKEEIACITPRHFFSPKFFIMNPEGSFHGIGYGQLLLDIAEVVNTGMNQLIDAGHLANTQGGFISKNVKIKKEDLVLERGEWIVAEGATGTDLKDGIVPINYREPSVVLLELVKSLVEAAQQLTSTTEVLTGTADTTNASPNTVFALIQQSLKVNSAIVRRILRGTKDEIDKIVRLAVETLDVNKYLQIIDPTAEELQEMFDEKGNLLDFNFDMFDIVPVADGEMSTEAENAVRAQQEFTAGVQLVQLGAVDGRELARSFFQAIQSPNANKLIAPPPDPNIPNPQMIKLQSDIDLRSKQLQLKEREVAAKEAKVPSEVQKTTTEAVKNLAVADVENAAVHLEAHKHVLDTMVKSTELGLQTAETQSKVDKNTVDSASKATKALKDQPLTLPSPSAVRREALRRGYKVNA